jgi:prepilin-type processing-associated H-X9-DG protein/prepilin-type N-terminal cleavage/methylation domain-containing protein
MTSPSRDRPGCPDRTGFTLVELLVVIGVIVLLMGIFLAAIAKARQTANSVSCASNLRQWGMATQMYANENNGFLPRRGQGVGPTFQIARPADWFNALPPILRMKRYMDLVGAEGVPRPPGSTLWLCAQASDFDSKYYWSYGMNMALSVWEANQNNGQPNKITGVGSTATMVLFADAPGNYCSVFPSKSPGGYNPVPRHSNRVNICFLDGHVEGIDPSYIGVGTGLIEHPDVRWRPPDSTWNSAQ